MSFEIKVMLLHLFSIYTESESMLNKCKYTILL